MELNEYQKQAMKTCMPSCKNFSYMMLNLVGEVGELASKVGKMIRKEQAYIGSQRSETAGDSELYISGMREDLDEEMRHIKLEAGDILWQLQGLCTVMGWTLEEVAQANLDKLASRKERKVIDGDGDDR